MHKLVFAAFAAALSVAAPALAQDTQSNDDIVVTASRLNEMIREFVGEVSVEQQAEGQIARWDRRVCPQIAGLRQRQAQFVADRLSQRVHQIGLQPGDAACRPNVLIFVTPEADRFTRELTAQFPTVFNPSVPNMHQQSDENLARFVSSDAPVRWWHVSQTVSMVRTGITSRIQRPTHQDFNRVVIVVDATAASGRRFDALADYIAMVTLAQIDPDADTAEADTILNLFKHAEGDRAEAMTTWDLAYLEGLYEARPNAWTARQQEADISRRMRTTELDAEYLDQN
jgi:hypothetical protein